MSGATFFRRKCPVCGRRLHIRVQYLGRKVQCKHCAANFVAADPSLPADDAADTGEDLLQRADALLATFEQLRHRPR